MGGVVVRELEGKGRRRRRVALVVAVLLVAGACSYVPFDFDGDKRADVAWVEDNEWSTDQPSQRWWRAGEAAPFHQLATVDNPGGGAYLAYSGFIAVPGDYDGNGVWEPATVLLPSGTTWDTTGSRGAISFPPPSLPTTTSTCGPRPYVYPVPADYDGDGKTDPAWYRETDATWWIAGQPGPIGFGDPWQDCPGGEAFTSYDIAVPGDYDGDKKADLAVFNPQTRHWRVLRSSDGVVDDVVFGKVGDMPAPADYDGDGKTDRATLGMTDDTWRIAGRAPLVIASGSGSRLPAPANYDGTPGAEPAELVLESGSWFIQGQATVQIPAVLSGSSEPWPWPVATPPALRFSLLRLTFLGRNCEPLITPPASQPAYCSA